MKIDQQVVSDIIERAKKSDYGLSEGLKNKNGHLLLETYGAKPYNMEILATCLVNAYHNKYDLISIFQAALEIVDNQVNTIE